ATSPLLSRVTSCALTTSGVRPAWSAIRPHDAGCCAADRIACSTMSHGFMEGFLSIRLCRGLCGRLVADGGTVAGLGEVTGGEKVGEDLGDTAVLEPNRRLDVLGAGRTGADGVEDGAVRGAETLPALRGCGRLGGTVDELESRELHDFRDGGGLRRPRRALEHVGRQMAVAERLDAGPGPFPAGGGRGVPVPVGGASGEGRGNRELVEAGTGLRGEPPGGTRSPLGFGVAVPERRSAGPGLLAALHVRVP